MKRITLIMTVVAVIVLFNYDVFANTRIATNPSKPNIILVMSDDQGWGQVGYYNHPFLETPNLDSMAKNGLRFDRFYSGAPNCSTTRATILTGRTNDRTGVIDHSHALRLQERTLAEALRRQGYATAHFGKWHLDGIRGPGVPILATDPYNPGRFGFEQWLSTTNFFELNPILSRNGKFEEFQGDSSEVIVAEALKFIRLQQKKHKPFFTTIWYGSPHRPFFATQEDKESLVEVEEEEAKNHYGEIVAIDRSIGKLRSTLREMGIEKNTIIWFNSDNGGLGDFGSITTGGLRGYKSSLYEGGIRVPGIIEWPNGITKPRVTQFPASTLDILPTLANIADIPKSLMLEPHDGMSLTKLFTTEIKRRDKPIPFRYKGSGALIDNEFKLITSDYQQGKYELYDLSQDPQEIRNLIDELPNVARSLRTTFEAWNQTVEFSIAGKDYPEGKLTKPDRKAVRWTSMPEYKPYVATWGQRPEYQKLLDYVQLGSARRITRWSLRLAFVMGIFLAIWFWRRKQRV